MKYFKRIVLAGVGLVVAWGILCNLGAVSVIKERREIVVKPSPEDVFEFLNDDAKLSSWVNGIESIKPFGEPSEGLGAKAKLVVSLPTKMEFVSEVTEWDPPRRFAWTVDDHGMKSTQTYNLEEVDGGTRIVLSVIHEPRTWMTKLFSPLIGWTIKKERAKEMIRLRDALNGL